MRKQKALKFSKKYSQKQKAFKFSKNIHNFLKTFSKIWYVGLFFVVESGEMSGYKFSQKKLIL